MASSEEGGVASDGAAPVPDAFAAYASRVPFSGDYAPQVEDGAELPSMEPAVTKKKKKPASKGAKVRMGRDDEVIDDEFQPEDEDEYESSERTREEAALARRMGIPVSSDGLSATLAGSMIGGGRAGHAPTATLAVDPSAAAARPLTLPEYKTRVADIVREFFLSEDYDEVRTSLEELRMPWFEYEFVRKGVTMAMEKGNRERELVSRLLSYLYGTDINMEQIGKGFERLFEVIDDLKLDVPDARVLAAKFLARAVADEILPPAYLNDPYVASLAGDIVEQAKALLSIKHASARLEHVWHTTGVSTVPELKSAIRAALDEFFVEHEADEVVRCVKELNVPHFGHEVAYRAVVLTLSHWPNVEVVERVEQLLRSLKEHELLSETQLVKAFQRLYANVADLALDAPQAKHAIDAMFKHLVHAGTLSGRAAGMVSTPKASASAAAAAQ